mmetsp:Transcript_15103/g.30612  ORF Transcript_15103/g.30612 Transcript_15103/m.30612 type:complete len:215 (-) Transcript_15103:28-672(-)
MNRVSVWASQFQNTQNPCRKKNARTPSCSENSSEVPETRQLSESQVKHPSDRRCTARLRRFHPSDSHRTHTRGRGGRISGFLWSSMLGSRSSSFLEGSFRRGRRPWRGVAVVSEESMCPPVSLGGVVDRNAAPWRGLTARRQRRDFQRPTARTMMEPYHLQLPSSQTNMCGRSAVSELGLPSPAQGGRIFIVSQSASITRALSGSVTWVDHVRS